MYDVITLGSATKDVFLFLDKSNLKPGVKKHFLDIPIDKKIDIKEKIEFTGGSATNAAATFASFEKKTAVMALVGDDGAAEFISNDMKSRRIDQEYLIRTAGQTPFSNILVASNGEMVVLVYRGIERGWKEEELRLDFSSKWLYIGPMPGEGYKMLPKILDYCEERGIKTVMNPGSTELSLKIKKMEPILNRLNIVSMNDEEARTFIGYGNDVNNIIKLAKEVKDAAIITKGSLGSMVATKDKVYSAGAFRTKQINYIGAGDAFLSGFTNAIIDDKTVEEAINLGSYNAASVVKRYGAKDGIVDHYPKNALPIKVTSVPGNG